MIEASFDFLIRQLATEDRGTVLTRNDAPRDKTVALANQLHIVDHGTRRIARTHEIRMHRMQHKFGLDRLLRRAHRLRHHLSAVQTNARTPVAVTAKQVVVELFQAIRRDDIFENLAQGPLLKNYRSMLTVTRA